MSKEEKINTENLNNDKNIIEIDLNDNQPVNIEVLNDGTEIIKDDSHGDDVNEEEIIDDESLRKIVAFATGRKNIDDDELKQLRKNDQELERLIKITKIKSERLTYNPKKNFGDKYKQKRKSKNRAAKKSRISNRKK